MMFQSHAGSIEELAKPGGGVARSQFQSHAGSIEAERERHERLYIIGFNPTLVRLRTSRRATSS